MSPAPHAVRRALACAMTALLLAAPSAAQSGGADAAPAPGAAPAPQASPVDASQVEKIPQERLEEIDAERKVLRSLEQNRPRHRISRYLGAAAEKTDEGDTQEALALLDRLGDGRMNPYERALVARLRAYVHYSAGDTLAAIEAFRTALDQEILELRDEKRIRFNIAQLYAGEQLWPEAVDALRDWFRYEQDPDPLAYYLLAVAYFQQDQLELAIANAERAVDRSGEPREGWLQLLAALYVQKQDYAAATPVLEELVLRYPKKNYWVQLSLIYGARENYRHSLAVQQVAYLQGLLTEDEELRRLARSYLFADLPYEAAKLIEKGLEEGRIEADADAYEMLANSWIAAREYDRSLDPLLKAAQLSEDGTTYMRLGQVRLQREEWGEAVEMFERALEKGGLDKPGTPLLLLGIASYNEGRIGPARRYFIQARQHESTRGQAETWLKHLESESQAAGDTARRGGAARPLA